MGKKGKKTASEVSGVIGGSGGAPDEGFVSCLPCLYCDKVSFEVTDMCSYASHLTTDHKVDKNVDKLLELTLQLQADQPKVKAVKKPEESTFKTSREDEPSAEKKADVKDNSIQKKKDDDEWPELPVKRNATVLNVEKADSSKKDSAKLPNLSKEKTDQKNGEKVQKTEEKKTDKKEKKEKKEEKKGKVEENKEKVEDKKEDKKEKKGIVEENKEKVDEKKEPGKKKKNKKNKEISKLEEKGGTDAESEAKAEVDNLLLQWSKGGREEVDESTNSGEKAVGAVEKKETATKKKNKKAKGKTTLKGSLPELGAQGYVEKGGVQESENILDDWFKGGRCEADDDDDDVPGELPDIDDQYVPLIPEAKIQNTKPMKGSPIKANKKPKEKSKPSIPKEKLSTKPKEQKKDTKMSTKVEEEFSALDEVNDMLDEWFADEADGIDEEEPASRFQELSDEDEDNEEHEVNKEDEANVENRDTKEDEVNDLDEVNDILDEWFAGEGADETGMEEKERVAEPDVTVEPTQPVVAEDPMPKDLVPAGDCVVCGRLAKAACSGCKHVFYCTRDHQKKDWVSHKENCREFALLPYRVERNPVVGRFLAATKNLKEGELILQESPMIVGPRQMTKPVCLGCHKEIKSEKEAIKCARCNWPVCSLRCQDSAMHDPECRATRAAGSRIKVEVFDQTNMMYACITILRALALLDGSKKIWDDYMAFDSHLSERIKTQVYSKVNKEKVVFFMHHYLGIKRYSDLEILEACGKLDTNCFEIRQGGLNLRAMYRTACIISHDCTPNTRHTFAPDHSINIYTTTNIEKGSVISATYTNSLWPTQQRREHLRVSKCFGCQCLRCRDPTELGSFLSAVRCSRCKGFRDNIQSDDMQYLVPNNPIDEESVWRCSKCTNIQRAAQIKAGNASVSTELSKVRGGSVEQLLSFLHQQEPVLGTNNHFVVEVKYTIVSMLGNRKPYLLEDLSMQYLQIKERFCRELLNVADKIEPGCSRWRGQLLLELQMAIVALAAGQAENGMISRGKAKELAEEGFKTLQVATAILQVEPDMVEVLEDRMKSVSSLLAQWDQE